MNWKKILKRQPLDNEDEKEIQQLVRFRNISREEAERTIRRKKGKMGYKRPAHGRFIKQDLEANILAEIKKEGGALGMKNLKQFGEESEIKAALSNLQKKRKIFMHRDGDIYTHKPASKRRGPFTA